MALRVAANLTPMFNECGSLLSRFAPAYKAGFKLVEICFPYSERAEALAREADQYNLTTILINTDPGNVEAGEMGCACIPGKEGTFKDSLNKAIIYAKALNVKMVHVMAGKYDMNHTEEEHQHTLEENLRFAASQFQKHGIVGLIEPKNNFDFPGYYLNNFDKAVSLVFKINSPHLRLQLDLYHLQLISGAVTRNIERLVPYTAHVQVSQPPHRSEPNSPGELDFRFIITKLKEAGYTGYIGAEYRPSTKRTESSLAWIKQCGLHY